MNIRHGRVTIDGIILFSTERLQEKARMTKEELGRCHQTRPQINGLNLGRSRGTGE